MSRSPDCVLEWLLDSVASSEDDVEDEVVEPAPKRTKFRIQDGKMRACPTNLFHKATPVYPISKYEALIRAEFLKMHPLHGYFILSEYVQNLLHDEQEHYKPLVHELICGSASTWEPLEAMLQEASVAVDEWSAVVCH
jgi:hypothetical protein